MNKLKKGSRNSCESALAAFAALLIFCAVTQGNEHTVLAVRVTSADGTPLEQARVTISSLEAGIRREIVADKRGFFQIAAIPYGTYTLAFEAKGYRPRLYEGLVMEPTRSILLKISLLPTASAERTAPQPIVIDFTDFSSQTILTQEQIDSFPSGNSIWSLIENQDLSSTTNRIDIGGLWASVPGLYSARGGASWTQNAYDLNGLDATDPVWTGFPLFAPDFFCIRYLRLRNSAHTPDFLFPGGSLSLIPKEGGRVLHGGFSAWYTDRNFTTTNITTALQKENLFQSHSLSYFRNANAHLSGSLVKDKLFFFTSFTGLDQGRNIADFSREDEGRVFSGLVNVRYSTGFGKITFFWTGQMVKNPTFGAKRGVSVSSTTDQENQFNVFQLAWESRLHDRHVFNMGASYSRGILNSRQQKDAYGLPGVEIFRNIPSGPAAWNGSDERTSLVVSGRGLSLFGGADSAQHRLDYGFEIKSGRSSSDQNVPGNILQRFFEGQPLEVVRLKSPFRHKESSLHLGFFAQDTITLPNLISFSFGLHVSSAQGWIPAEKNGPAAKVTFSGNEIAWMNFSPRLSFSLPLARTKTSAIKISAERYFFALPLHLLTWGNTSAPAGQVFAWTDLNGDRKFQEGEAGALIRREGPGFARIDPNLKRPFTDELSIGIIHSLGRGFMFSLAGFYRESRDLLDTLNIGVPLSAYDPVILREIGDDRIWGTHDDLTFTVFNQKKETLGNDFFLLTNPDAASRITRYRGLDLTVVKKFSGQAVFFLSLTATEAIGTTSPGNTEWENDDSLPGALYDNPNAAINAKGRLRFDRAYTGRIGFTLDLPLGLRAASLVKYYDGQPFARKIIVTGFNQGPFFIQAHPRGVARYEYNMTVDARIEKIIAFNGSRLRLILDAFNIFNRNLATAENEWTGPEWPLRFATEIQSPRIFRFGVSYEF